MAKPRTGPVICSLPASLTVEAQHILGGSAPDDDEIDHDKTDTFKRRLPSPSTTDVLSLIHISGEKGMCVDYRALNDCTPDASWPIPNIAEMLRRIGSRKVKFLVSWTLHKDIIKLLLVTQAPYYLLWGI